MQQIIRRLRPLPQPLRGQKGSLPSYMLFAPGLALDDWEPMAAAPAPTRRRRKSVLIFLERVLCLT